MIYCVRRKNDTNEKMLRRFKKQVQQENLVRRIRNSRYFTPAKTKSRVRDEAIMRTHYRHKKMERILWS